MYYTIQVEVLTLQVEQLITTQVEVITIQVEDRLTDNHQTTKKKVFIYDKKAAHSSGFFYIFNL